MKGFNTLKVSSAGHGFVGNVYTIGDAYVCILCTYYGSRRVVREVVTLYRVVLAKTTNGGYRYRDYRYWYFGYFRVIRFFILVLEGLVMDLALSEITYEAPIKSIGVTGFCSIASCLRISNNGLTALGLREYTIIMSRILSTGNSNGLLGAVLQSSSKDVLLINDWGQRIRIYFVFYCDE